MRLRFAATFLAALTAVLLVAAVSGAAMIGIYRNGMETTAQRAQLIKLAGADCTRGGSEGALRIAIGKATDACSYRTPVLGRNLEIAATERKKAVERVGVALACVDPCGELLGCCCQRLLCSRDAGPAPEQRSDRLARRESVLLRQIAGGERRRLTDDRAAVRELETTEDPEQRRLAGAVSPDEPEPGARVDLQADAVENDMGTVLTHDIDKLKTHRTPFQPDQRQPRRRRLPTSGGRENVDGVSVGHGAAFRTPPGT
jgi:hypothetical protein